MAFGIPSYRLPKDILQSEIAAIEALGIKIKLNTRVGLRPKFHDLIKKFDAVFIATGAAKPRKLGIRGEKDVQGGLVDWVPLLREVALGGGEKPGEKVVIIGGGVSKTGELIFAPARQVVAERVMRDIEVRIVPAALGDDPGLLGAVAMVLRHAPN